MPGFDEEDDDPYGFGIGTITAPKPKRARARTAPPPQIEPAAPEQAAPLPTDDEDDPYGFFAAAPEPERTALAEAAGAAAGPPRPLRLGEGRGELRTPTEPSLLDELSTGYNSFMQGLYGNTLDELRPMMQFPEGSPAPTSEEFLRAAKENPAAHLAGQVTQGVGASVAVPGTVGAQALTQGALAAGSQHADTHDWTDTILAGIKGGALGGAMTHLGNLAGNMMAKPSLAGIQPTVDDLRNAWAARGKPMPESGRQVPLSELPPDPFRDAARRQAQEAAAAAPEPPPAYGPPAEDPFHGRQAELSRLPAEPPPPMAPPGPAQDPFHGRMPEISRTPPEPMGPPPALVPGAPAKDPFHGRAGKFARTPGEPVPEAVGASPTDPFAGGAAYRAKPDNPWWMDPDFAQAPADLETGAAPRWQATIDLPPGRGHNRKFALDAELPPRPAWSEAEAAPALETARVAKPKRPAWAEPDAPAPETPLELAADVPARPGRTWEPPVEQQLELAADVPASQPRVWSEPEPPPALDLAFQPTRVVGAETPGYLKPSFVESVQREAQKQLAKLPTPQANTPATSNNVLEVLGIVKGGVAGRAIRAGGRMLGVGGPSARQLAIQSGALVPNQTVKQVAYATAPTLNYALQAVLSSGRTPLPPADQQRLTTALTSRDQGAVNSAWHQVQQTAAEFARYVRDELESLTEQD